MHLKKMLSIITVLVLSASFSAGGVAAKEKAASSPEKKVTAKKAAGAKKTARTKAYGKTFYGKIIYLGSDVCEVKSGMREVSAGFTPETIVVARDGSKKDKAILELCQIVRITYAKKGKENVLKRIVVAKPSTCSR